MTLCCTFDSAYIVYSTLYSKVNIQKTDTFWITFIFFLRMIYMGFHLTLNYWAIKRDVTTENRQVQNNFQSEYYILYLSNRVAARKTNRAHHIQTGLSSLH